MDNPDLYRIMGVEKTATKAEIKRAYRSLAMKYHPDKRQDNKEEAEKKFIEISNAYKILVDDQERKKYDACGLSKGHRHYTSERSELDNLYARFYGKECTGNVNNEKYRDTCYSPSREYVAKQGMSHSMPNRQHYEQQPYVPPRRGSNACYNSQYIGEDDDYLPSLIGQITVRVYLTVEEMYQGCTKVYNVARCRDGIIEHKVCTLTLFPGTAEGTEIKAKGSGNKMIGKPADDIVFLIKQIPNDRYKVEGCDIIETIKIPLKDALLGFQLDVTCFSGNKVERFLEGPLEDGLEVVIPEEGLIDPETKEKGDHVLTFSVQYPTKLTQEQRDSILTCFA